MKIVLIIAASLIAVLSMLATIDALLTWFGHFYNIENLTVQVTIFLCFVLFCFVFSLFHFILALPFPNLITFFFSFFFFFFFWLKLN
jgi:nucleoside permease NupC